jgi:hypothetical protein
VDEELEGEAEKVASDHKDSTGEKSAHSKESLKMLNGGDGGLSFL